MTHSQSLVIRLYLRPSVQQPTSICQWEGSLYAIIRSITRKQPLPSRILGRSTEMHSKRLFSLALLSVCVIAATIALVAQEPDSTEKDAFNQTIASVQLNDESI